MIVEFLTGSDWYLYEQGLGRGAQMSETHLRHRRWA